MLIRNILALNAVYAAKLVLPLVMLPMLARRLSTDSYGVYLYSLGLSAWLSLFIEYGFTLYATREMAGKDLAGQSEVVTGTQSARLIMAVLMLPVALICAGSLKIYESQEWWGIVAWLMAVLIGSAPVYYFQAKEELRKVAIVEVMASTIMLALAFLFVNDDHDAMVLATILVLSRLISNAYLTKQMWRQLGIGFRSFLKINYGVQYLKRAFIFFVFQAAVSLYTSFNVVFLGMLRPASDVAIYASAERLIRAGLGFIGQASQVVYARLNNMRAAGSDKFEKLRRLVLLAMFGIGIFGAVAVWLLAEQVARYFVPEAASEVAWTLRIFALLVPAVALNTVLGLHYLIVGGLEKVFNRIIVCAALANLLMSWFAISSNGYQGLAVMWVLVEWGIAAAIAATIFYNKKQHLSKQI